MSTLTTLNQVTLADVAARSGVSTSSVSKVLNLQPEQYRMSDETRQRILDAVAQLGYRPNFRARSLAKGRSHNIGVLFEGSLPTILRENESGVLGGFEPILRQAEYQVIFIPIRPGSDDWMQMLSDRRVDACLVVNKLEDQVQQVLKQLNIPAVLVNGITDDDVPTCNVDNVGMAKALTEHLLSLGHQRIWMYTNIHAHKHHSVSEREAGYQQAMTHAGLSDQINSMHMVFEDFVEHLVYAPIRPTAVVVYQHLEAVRLLQAFWRHGIKVPEDISVATFNNTYPVSHVIPPLTTMALPMTQIGEHAAKLLLSMIENGNANQPVHEIERFADWHLVVRESTAQVSA